MTKPVERIEIDVSHLNPINDWVKEHKYKLLRVISRWQIPYCFDVPDCKRNYYEIEVKLFSIFVVLNKNKMREFLINDENIELMSVKENSDFNVKRLLNNNRLDQSQSIRFGKIFEKFIKDLIKSKGYKLINEELVDVYGTGTKTNKGKKDLDICFIKGNTIFYFESKLNLNLDSEKSKATDEKIHSITEYLIKGNKENEIFSGLITCWWEKEEGMSITTKTNLLFMSDFLEILDIKTTKEEYYKLMSDFGKLI